MIETGLKSFLTSAATSAAGRIYPLVLPQAPVLPAMTYQRVSGNRVKSLSGPSGLAHPRFQIDCWGATYNEAKTLAQEVRRVIDGYRGQMGSIRVGGAIVLSDRDIHEPEAEDYRVTIDVTIWHDET